MCKKGCIYCGVTDNLTYSDIIPDALTNARIYNKYVCKVEHNSRMTEKFESIVAKKLAFITNVLNIKSSNSKGYAEYSCIVQLGDNNYEVKRLRSKEDIFNKVLWDKERNKAIGNIDTIRKIAESKGNVEVNEIDINNTELVEKVKIDIEIFFSLEMYRQVAKIAFEWYCARNNVQGKHEDFDEIIKYIVDGEGDNIVNIVADTEVNEKFEKYCNNGSHCLIGYISKTKEVRVFVNLFGLIIYDVKVCNHIPEFCHNNCLLQKLNLDSTRKSLCLKDYNGLMDDIVELINSKEEVMPKVSVNGVRICTPKFKKDLSSNFFYMELLNNLQKGFKKENEATEEIVDRLINNIKELLKGSLINKKVLKRFVDEKIDFSKDLRLNPNGSEKKSIFLFYILFLIGDKNIEYLNDKILKIIISEKFGNNHIVLTDEKCEEIRNQMLKEDYSNIIKKGAKKVKNWDKSDNI